MGVMLVLGVTCGSSVLLSAPGKKTYEQRKKKVYILFKILKQMLVKW